MWNPFRSKPRPTVAPEYCGETQLGNPVFVQTSTGYYLKFPVLEPTEKFPFKSIAVSPAHYGQIVGLKDE